MVVTPPDIESFSIVARIDQPSSLGHEVWGLESWQVFAIVLIPLRYFALCVGGPALRWPQAESSRIGGRMLGKSLSPQLDVV